MPMRLSYDAAWFDGLFESYPLHLATSHGDVPEIHRVLDMGYDINKLHLPSHMAGLGSALHIAVWSDQPAAFAALLERGANMDILDEASGNEGKIEDTPIRLAVRLGRRDMVRKLWNSGAQKQLYPKGEDSAGRVPVESGTLLEVAAGEGYPDIVCDMLSWKSDWTYGQRYNALAEACLLFDIDATRLLLEDFQYDPAHLEEIALNTITYMDGPSDWYYSDFESPEEMNAGLWRMGEIGAKVIGALLDSHHGQVIDDPQAHQALLNRLIPRAAMLPFRIESLRLLLQSGADPNASERGYKTPLQSTLNTSRWDIPTFDREGVKLLLHYGARTDDLNKAEKSNLEIWRMKNTEEL